MASLTRPTRKEQTGRKPYRHTAQHYSTTYGTPPGTISQWWRKSYALDNPEKLFEQVMAQKNKPSNLKHLRALKHLDKIPGPTVSGSRGVRKPRRASEDPVEPTSPVPPARSDPPRASSKTDAGTRGSDDRGRIDALEGLQRQLARLEHETNAAYELYESSEDALDKAAMWKTWQGMLDQWGKLAKAAPEAEYQAGLFVRRDEVEKTWERTFAEIRTTLETLPRRISTHAKVRASGINPVDVEIAVKEEVKRVMTQLQDGDTTVKDDK